MSGKSKEEVAFELLAKLKGVGIWGENNIEAILDMYAKCLEATAGLRPVDGKAPTALRLAGQEAAPAPAQTTPNLAPRQAAPARPPAPPQQPQLRQAQQVAAQPAYQQQVAQPR